MKTMKKLILGALAVVGAWCAMAESDISNGGFESPALSTSPGYNGEWKYCEPTGWIGSKCGLQRKKTEVYAYAGEVEIPSTWCNKIYQGKQVAFLQGEGYLQQTVDFSDAGIYHLSFAWTGRSGYLNHQVDVTLDEVKLFTYTAFDTDWHLESVIITIDKPGLRVLKFVGSGSDNFCSCLDAVSVGKTTPIKYLSPLFDAKGAVTNYEEKSCASYSLYSGGTYDDVITLDPGWHVFAGHVKARKSIVAKGLVRIILCDGCCVESKNKDAGLSVEIGSESIIFAQSTNKTSMGVLEAWGDEGPGIGSYRDAGGPIIINGGRIIAVGKYYTAVGKSYASPGIGALALKGNESYVGGRITINGGIVTATGSTQAAGIGGAYNNNVNSISINGGVVIATGGSNAAGIGSGPGGSCQNITINGGTVTATGGDDGAGIGTGDSDYDSRTTAEKITINGGVVTATGKESGAGIGGGQYSHASGITINGGTVVATGGPASAGIGGGGRAGYQGGVGKNITITGGSVTANGGQYAAGIGGANRADGYDITISGGKVTATGGSDGGAAIGGGANGQGYNLTFAGGTVSAKLDSGSDYAAIGSGKNGTAASNIRVTGGNIHSDNFVLFSGNVHNAEGKALRNVTIPDVPLLGPVSAAGIPNYGLNDLYPCLDIYTAKYLLYFRLPQGDYQFAVGSRIYTANVGLVISKVTSVENADPVRINGTSFLEGKGTGWTFANNVLTLNEARDYTLTGTDLYGQLRVVVTANATVTLNGATLKQPCRNVPCVMFASGATDAKLVLTGDNTVYSQNGYPAVDIQPGAKVTLSGTGALVGGKAAGVNSRGFYNNGTLVVAGGTIRDYACSQDGGAIYNNGMVTVEGGTISNNFAAVHGGAICNAGTVRINGGSFLENVADSDMSWAGFCFTMSNCRTSIYGGYFRGNRTRYPENAHLYIATDRVKDTGYLYGGVFAADPTAAEESSGCLVLQNGATVNQVGSNWIVGIAMTQLDEKLAGGTYTFDPTKAEYAAAGVAIAPNHRVASAGTGLYRIERDVAGLTVDGVDLSDGSGEGWTYESASKTLSLAGARAFVLSGAPSDGVAVQVTSCATVTLDRVTLVNKRDTAGITFGPGATDAKLVLLGDNTVYSQNDCPAVDIATGAKITLSGTGALVGGKAASKNSRGVYNRGTFVMDSGTIRDYATSGDGGAVYNNGTFIMEDGMISGNEAVNGAALANNGTATITGGKITDNTASSWGGFCYSLTDCQTSVYGGVFSGNQTTRSDACNLYVGQNVQKNGRLFGGVFAADPTADKESRSCLVLQNGATVNEVGSNWIVGTNVTQRSGALTGGTYAFDPSRAEYAAAGVTLADKRIVEVMGTDPETYRVHVVANFQVDGVRLENGTGKDGWTFEQVEDTGYLTLAAPRPYELTGYADLTLLVDVLSNATVTLNGARIRAGAAGREIIRVSAEDATIVLKGTNTFYTTDGHAAIGVAKDAKLTLKGDGELVGGRTSGANGRCVTVAAGGALVLDGGTIRDYYTTANGGAIYTEGAVTLNQGRILNCRSANGGALYNNGGTVVMNGGVVENGSASRGAAFGVRSGTLDIYGGTIRGNSGTASILNMEGGTVTLLGGVYTGNYGERPLNNASGSLTVCGGVFDFQPSANHGSQPMSFGGSTETKVGDLWVVAANVETRVDKLIYIMVRGDFTFSPTNSEYATAGLVVWTDAALIAVGETDYRLSTVSFSTNNIGVCSWSWATNMTEVLERMEQSGVKNMSLALAPWLKPSDGSKYKGPFGSPETEEMFASISNKIATSEITVPSTMLSFPKENWGSYESITNTVGIMYTGDPSDPTGARAWIVNSNLVEQAAIRTKKLGVKYLTCFVGFLMKPIMIYDINVNENGNIGLSRLKEAQDLCAKHGVTLLLESGHYSGEVTTNILAAFEQKYGAGDYPLAINFDAANHLVYGNDTPRNAYDVMKSRIAQVHIKDAKKGPAASGFAADVKWGTGDVSTKYDLLKYLRDDDYSGHLLVECEAGDTDAKRIECIKAALQALLVANNTDPADKWVSPVAVMGVSADKSCENALKAQGFKPEVSKALGTTELYILFRSWADGKGLDPNGLISKDGIILASAYNANKVEDPTNVVVTIDEFVAGIDSDGTMEFLFSVEADGYNGPIDEKLLKASLGVEGTTDLEATAFSPDALTFEFGTVTEGYFPIMVTPKKVGGENPENFFLRTTAK